MLFHTASFNLLEYAYSFYDFGQSLNKQINNEKLYFNSLNQKEYFILLEGLSISSSLSLIA